MVTGKRNIVSMLSDEEKLKMVLDSSTKDHIILYYNVGCLTLFTSIPKDDPNSLEISKQFYSYLKYGTFN
jgi:hypothetical protein